MSCFDPIDLDETSPNALLAARSARLFAAHRNMVATRAAFSPMVVLSTALLIFGCYALLTVTGVGSGSWQGRMCRNDVVQPRFCKAPLAAGAAVRANVAQLPGASS